MRNLSDDEQVEQLLKTQAERYPAPAELRAQISQLAKINLPNKTSHSWLSWLIPQLPQALPGVAMGAIVASLLTNLWMANLQDKKVMLMAIAADHARAVVTENTIEVKSSSMHTVKPWLSSKLGYSPQIVDLAEQGYPLIGGRRGFVGATPVAVAVYAYKLHEIDVYALSSTMQHHMLASATSMDGFNTSSWQSGDITYVAISDMNVKQFAVFSKLLELKQNESL